MKSSITNSTLRALVGRFPENGKLVEMIREHTGFGATGDVRSGRWVELEVWNHLAEEIIATDVLSGEEFYEAGLSCADQSLLGPLEYLPLFIGSPALLFHNLSALLSLLDNFLVPGKIFVGEEQCIVELKNRTGREVSTSYYEFLRGYLCATASLWHCRVKSSTVHHRRDDHLAALMLNWNISELHNRRALEELLIEREFFTEMFDGLRRINESHSEHFSPLVEQNIKMKERLLQSDSQPSAPEPETYRQTNIYDGFIALNSDFEIIRITGGALQLLNFETESAFFAKNRHLKHLLVRDSFTARELLEELRRSSDHRAVYSVFNGRGMYQEVEISLASEFAVAEDEMARLVLRDVTLAAKLNMPLEPTRQVLDALFTNNPAALQIINSQGWTTKVNRQFEDLFGVSESEFVGVGIYNVLEDKGVARSGLSSLLQKVINTNERGSKMLALGDRRYEESPLLANINETLVLEVNAFPISRSRDRSTSVIVSYSDITESYLSQQQLAQTDKLRSIGTLTSGIAHDFNNILGAIVPNADFIMSQAEDNSAIYRKASAIKSASKRASELMRQLMTYARQSKLNKQRVHFNNCVGEALELIQNAIPKSVAISFDKEIDDGHVILADPLQMQQLLINLLINAADAQPGGGHISVRTKKHTLRQRSTFAGNIIEAGDYVAVVVEDRGHGMSPEVIDRVFDPFFTTKEKGRGTGLGLSVVHGIVKNHQGYIEIKSWKEEGTAINVYLPLLDAGGQGDNE